MTPPELDQHEFRRRFSELCDGTASRDDVVQLEVPLNYNPRVRQIYLEYMAVHAALYRLARPDNDAARGHSLVDWERVFTARPAAAEKVELANRVARAIEWHRHPVHFIMTVLFLVFAALLAFTAIVGPGERHQPLAERQGAAPPAKLTVARLTGSVHARWRDDASPGLGTFLRPSQRLGLLSGFVEITFDSGARVILQGPAELVIGDPEEGPAAGSALLAEGTLTTRAETSARGFTIDTPAGSIVDLGTEFSVEVAGEEAATVHVFEGEVQAYLAGGVGKVRLGQGQTARIDARRQAIVPIAPDTARFVRELPALLNVDFASSTMDAATGHHIERGFDAFSRDTSHETKGPQSETYRSGLGREGLVRVVVDSDGDGLTWRDRGDKPGVPLGDVAEDFVAHKTTIVLTLEHLAAGEYSITTYHHDIDRAHGTIDVSVDDVLGTTRPAADGVTISHGESPPATAQFTFTADGIHPVIVRIARDTSPHAILNGFSLQRFSSH